jgi:hypothetical protein
LLISADWRTLSTSDCGASEEGFGLSTSAVVEHSPPRIEETAPPPVGPTEQSGSPLFAELVWAHYCYERARSRSRPDPDELQRLERLYHERLESFQRTVGKLEHAYWSTKEASAVAMTVQEEEPDHPHWARLAPNLLEHDQRIQLHRLSDWATRETPHVADLLQECDLLAIRVAEVLRGTPERIAMRSLLGVQAHLLGFVERGTPNADEKAFAKTQRDELAAVESYYHRAASRAGRLIYVSGMLMGLVPVLLLSVAGGLLLWTTGIWDRQAELVLLSTGAGAIGAFVSAISRMGKPEKGKFNVDFELGRPLIRRLGLFRPFLGAVAGVALCFLLASGVAQVELTGDQEVAYYGLFAFLAGFSERFATVMFGTAEKRFSKE